MGSAPLTIRFKRLFAILAFLFCGSSASIFAAIGAFFALFPMFFPIGKEVYMSIYNLINCPYSQRNGYYGDSSFSSSC